MIIWDLVIYLPDFLSEWPESYSVPYSSLLPYCIPCWLASSRKASSSYNQMDTTTFSFVHLLPSPCYKRTLPSSYQDFLSGAWGLTPWTLFCPCSPPQPLTGPPCLQLFCTATCAGLFSGFFLLKSLFRRLTALKTVGYSTFLEVSDVIPSLFLAHLLLRLLCWLCLLQPVLNVGIFHRLFLIYLPHFLCLSVSLRVSSSIPMTFSFYTLTISEVISSAQSSLLNHRPSWFFHLDVSQAFQIQFVLNWSSGFCHPSPYPRTNLFPCDGFHF